MKYTRYYLKISAVYDRMKKCPKCYKLFFIKDNLTFEQVHVNRIYPDYVKGENLRHDHLCFKRK